MIYAEQNFCSLCGAKWLENRITMKQVTHDFSDMYIGIDTKFIRTFLDLFKRPEAVITGYMNGRRVNYMDAMRYLLVALFITGIYTYFLKNMGVIDSMMEAQRPATIEAYQQMGMGEEEITETLVHINKLTKIAFEFQGFILLLTIPFLALAARITFWNKRYFNFVEQIVFYMYTYGHAVIVTTPFTMLLLFLTPDFIHYIGLVTLPLMYGYNIYCYKRCFRMGNMAILTKTLISIFVLIGILIAIGIVGVLFGIVLKVTGVF
ncbi:MAG: hypothetical protein ACI9WL_000207 [Rubritalea sp.]|jgi:hypothetical protein